MGNATLDAHINAAKRRDWKYVTGRACKPDPGPHGPPRLPWAQRTLHQEARRGIPAPGHASVASSSAHASRGIQSSHRANSGKSSGDASTKSSAKRTARGTATPSTTLHHSPERVLGSKCSEDS